MAFWIEQTKGSGDTQLMEGDQESGRDAARLPGPTRHEQILGICGERHGFSDIVDGCRPLPGCR